CFIKRGQCGILPYLASSSALLSRRAFVQSTLQGGALCYVHALPLFLRIYAVLAMHGRAIEEFGGLHGVRCWGTESRDDGCGNPGVLRTSIPPDLRRDVCLSPAMPSRRA